MTDYRIHKARPGQRWDNLSSLYYGDDFGYRPIIQENPEYIGTIAFEGGEVIRIPVIEVATDSNPGLPPWRQE